MLLGLGEEDLDDYQEDLVESKPTIKPVTIVNKEVKVAQPERVVQPEHITKTVAPTPAPLPKVSEVITTAPLTIKTIEDVTETKFKDLNEKTTYIRTTLGLDLKELITKYTREKLIAMLESYETPTQLRDGLIGGKN
jgi:hypothetical protein